MFVQSLGNYQVSRWNKSRIIHHMLHNRRLSILRQPKIEEISILKESPSFLQQVLLHLVHVLRMSLSSTPKYTWHHWPHGVRFPLSQLKVCSHQLWVESDHCIPLKTRICQSRHLQEMEAEEQFIFRCLIYHKIRGRYHSLFHDSRVPLHLSLS